MTELVFNKDFSEYYAEVSVPDKDDTITMALDTGSPISTICIQHLVQITKESKAGLLKRIEKHLDAGYYLSLNVYGSQEHKVKRTFIPYVLKDLIVAGEKVNYIIMWLDVTNYNHKHGATSMLFGFDNIKAGKKWFDDEDNFHIRANSCFNTDIFGIERALSNFGDAFITEGEIHRLFLKGKYNEREA
ncbi:MAG: hypothetical protein IJV04_01480 [Lachnospiraceae bacterium]|nr:hypothetical protein [Lachnospiraceae bacterium]